MFYQAGYHQATEDMLVNYTRDYLKNQNNYNQTVFKAKTTKAYEFLQSEVIQPVVETLTVDEFEEKMKIYQEA